MVEQKDIEVTFSKSILKTDLHEEQFSQNTYGMTALYIWNEIFIQPKLQESSPHNEVGQKRKIKRHQDSTGISEKDL